MPSNMTSEENKKEKLDSTPPSPAKVSEGNLGGQATQKEEKLEYLKREEIRTMEKDVKKLREVEAEKERERISNLEAEEKKVKLMPHPKGEIPKGETILSKPPKRPSPIIKILVRMGIILVLFSFLSFFYWYFGIKKPSAPEIIEKPTVEKPVEKPPEEKIIEKPEITVPLSLISVKEAKILEISENTEIPNLISPVLKEEFEKETFIRIIVKNTKESRLANLREILDSFGVKTPEQFYQKINPEKFTIFIYSQKKGGNRLGFVTKIQEKEGLSDLLKNWEPIMEENLNNLFKILGKEGAAPSPSFKEKEYKGITFHYLDFPQPNLGICWAISNDYFIFNSGGESMLKTIEKLLESS